MNKQKKGISLIVLVITIIVMIVLASAIIITLSNSNIIAKARAAVVKTDVKNFEQELSLTLADEKLANKDLDTTTVNATTLEEILKYIPDFDEKYLGKIFIQNGEVVYDETLVTADEKEALEAMGISTGKIYTPAEIKAIIEAKNLGDDISTTDITSYIEGLSKAHAEKYTIFQGELYYRYEKTTYEEQLELYAAEISILMGDANEDGTLTSEDRIRVGEVEVYYDAKEDERNLHYICNMDSDSLLGGVDTFIIQEIVDKSSSIIEWVPLENQNPDEIKFVGDYIWFSIGYGFVSSSIPDGLNTTDYTVMKEYCPTMTQDQGERFKIVDGELVYNAEVLTETEKAWADEYGLIYE